MFRFHKVILSADIAECTDEDFHRLFWKKTPSSLKKTNRFNRNVWHGVTSAGFLPYRHFLNEPKHHSTRCRPTFKFQSGNNFSQKKGLEYCKMPSSNIYLTLVFIYVRSYRMVFHLLNAFPRPIESQLTPNTSSVMSTSSKHLVPSETKTRHLHLSQETGRKILTNKRQLLFSLTNCHSFKIIHGSDLVG